jgi:hypothetical protein
MNPVVAGEAVAKSGRPDSQFKRELSERDEVLLRKVEKRIWEVRSKPQRMALECEADILLYGGAAGSLKTETLLVDAAAEIDNPNLNAVIFRASYPELADIVMKSQRLYRPLGGEFVDGNPKIWKFPSGARITFTYLARDKDVFKHQGQEYTFIGFDEAGHQNEFRVRYMLTRLRSTDKTLKLRMRLTANPGGSGHDFLFKLFLRGYCPHCTPDMAVETGRIYDDAVWPSDKQSVSVKLDDGTEVKKTVCFIAGKVTDHNLLGNDYIANLKTQSAATAAVLLSGCWKQWEGQYFDCYEETRGFEQDDNGRLVLKHPDLRQVLPIADVQVKHWYSHLVGGDYGFTISQAAAHLLVRLPATEDFPNGRLLVLDEFAEPGVTARDYAAELLNRWFLENGMVPELPRNFQMWAVSPDAFRKDGSVNDVDVPFSRIEQMNDVLSPYGLNFIRANDDRKSGWMLMYQMLRDGELIIADHCRKTRDMLMSRVRDPKKFDDILKVAGDPLDDVADSLRYAVMTWQTVAVKPREEKVQEILETLDPTNAMISIKQLEIQEREEQQPVFIGRSKASRLGRPGPRRPY